MPGPEYTLPGATSHQRFFRSLASFGPRAEAMRLVADPRHLTVESFRLNGEPRLLMHEAPLLNGEAVPAHG
jgi:hypothetical protein